MTFLRAKHLGPRLKRFLQSVPARAQGSFVSNQHDGISRLTSQCQTVTPEETAKLESKRRKPVDYDELGIIE